MRPPKAWVSAKTAAKLRKDAESWACQTPGAMRIRAPINTARLARMVKIKRAGEKGGSFEGDC
jgi:hypothetical protein